MEIEITINSSMITSKSVAWGGKNPEFFRASQEAIREAVQNNPNKEQLKQWLEDRRKLSMIVEFHLSNQRVHLTDIDSLLADLLNPLVEGACGSRFAGKPIPQTKDALFWQIHATKINSDEEKVIIKIKPLED